MKRFSMIAVLLALSTIGLAATALPLTGNLDFSVAQPQPVFAGWEVNLVTGLRPVSAQVFRFDNCSGELKLLSPDSFTWGDRPDVRAFFAAQGTFIQPTVGYGIILKTQKPGDYTYTIVFADAPASQQVDSYSVRVRVPLVLTVNDPNNQSTAVILE